MPSSDTLPIWKQILRSNFISWKKLADFLELSEQQRATIDERSKFPLNLPLRLAQKIQKGTLEDPILKQFLPTKTELQHSAIFSLDPIGDSCSKQTSKLLQKYEGRALLVCTSACAMHCRYCFRQHFDYDNTPSPFDNEIEAIAADPTIHEVILSGGDPLSLSDKRLSELFAKLSNLKHVRRLRFHTRFPMGIPERLDNNFLQLLAQLPQQIWFVIHANHPAEFDADVLASLSAIRKLGIVVLNQSVLLRGVNDNITTLKELCEILVDNGILPYYLHQLDRVQGASHFEVPEEEGRQLIAALRSQLSGYAIPAYVREISGEPSKTPL